MEPWKYNSYKEMVSAICPLKLAFLGWIVQWMLRTYP